MKESYQSYKEVVLGEQILVYDRVLGCNADAQRYLIPGGWGCRNDVTDDSVCLANDW